MRKNRKDKETGLSRRQALTGAAATLGFGLAAGKTLSAQERLAATLPGAKVCILTPEAVQGPFYFDPKLVRADVAEGRPGASLALTLQVASVKDCARLKGARVDLWHADGQGMYSGYRGQGDDGISTDLSARIYAGVAPYNDRKAKRDIVANEKDFIFEEQGGADTLVSVTEEGGSYLASIVVGVDRAG